MSAGGKFIGLFVSLGLPRSRVGRLFAPVEPGFVVGVVKGMPWAHERAVLGGARRHTLRWPLSDSVLVGRCAVVAAQLQTAHHKEFAELSVPRDAP